jgi:F-type H+-transporting ATPase subunit gamma
MTDSLEALRNRMDGANDLRAVVRTMKAMSASNITQYEHAVQALERYFATVEQGLIACLKQTDVMHSFTQNRKVDCEATNCGATNCGVTIIVFGSDQGLVGQFNDSLAEFVVEKLGQIKGQKNIWVVGDRIHGRLQDANLTLEKCFNVPSSVEWITPLIGDLLLATEHKWASNIHSPLYLFHQRPGKISGQYKAVMNQFLPLDSSWQLSLQNQPWLGPSLPQTLGTTELTLSALVREYLFVSIYQACAESLASENASRLIAMQRAEKNIEEMLASLQQKYHHQRQETIDAELFDVVAGYMSDD